MDQKQKQPESALPNKESADFPFFFPRFFIYFLTISLPGERDLFRLILLISIDSIPS